MVDEKDLKVNPHAITDYLEKHFKEKELLKKQRKMMGGDEDALREKIAKMEEDNFIHKKKIDTMDFKSRREVEQKEEKYM